MAARDLPPVPVKAPMTDPNGAPSQPWAAWFRQLYFRVGGSTAKTNIELDVGVPGSIGTAQIQDGAVTTPKLANAAVTTAKLGNLSVATGNVQDGAITSAKINDASVTTAKILDGNVTSAKIASQAVGAAQIADAAVGTAELADSSVTTPKIASQAVTLNKLSTAGASIGQVPQYNGSGISWGTPAIAGGGTLGTDGLGGNQIDISPPVTVFVLQDSGAVKWDVNINTDGTLYTVSGSSGTVTTGFKIQKPDSSYGQIAVNTDGTLYVDESPSATQVNNFCYLESSDLNLWQLAIDNNNEIQTISYAGTGAYLSIVSSTGVILWQLRSLPGYIALQYLQVLSAANLAVATPPPTVTGCLPLAMYNSGSNNRLVYYDSAWKYVHDNSLV